MRRVSEVRPELPAQPAWPWPGPRALTVLRVPQARKVRLERQVFRAGWWSVVPARRVPQVRKVRKAQPGRPVRRAIAWRVLQARGDAPVPPVFKA